MLVPMSWLKEYVDINDDIDNFMEEMTMIGQKVEGVTFLNDKIKNIVVGKIEKIEKHPDADKLIVCSVNVGSESNLNIVTGADNVYEGAIVPVAVDNSVIANGTKIKKGKLRGVVSEGMLCSIEELGYSKAEYPEAPENGIYIFREEQELGADVSELLMLKDEVVEYEIVSNRPDCFSITGIAREAAAAYNLPLKMPALETKNEAEGCAEDYINVQIKNPELCPRYIGRVVKNVKIKPSPLWMRHRLIAAGLRPINNIVDITNYVMLEIGQPMHAFDIDSIKGGIIVRNAEKGEKITTLDGSQFVLDDSMTVIADHEKAVAIGGVMGGENSMVSGEAKAILFESANFNGTNIRLTSKKLGLRTDSSTKYEKGLDPNLSLIAVNRAIHLTELLGAGEAVPGMVDCYPVKKEPWEIDFSPEQVNALLGTEIPVEKMREYLNLFEVNLDLNTMKAHIPTFRPDLEQMCDLAEEVARAYGYNEINVTMTTGTPTTGRRTYSQSVIDIIKQSMVSSGFYEGMSYSFESPKVFDKLLIEEESPLRNVVKVENPLGEDYSIMRTSMLNGLLNSVATNYNKRNPEAKLFLVENIYIKKDDEKDLLPDEKLMLTAGLYGDYDFYDIKGVCEELFQNLGIDGVKWEKEDTLPMYHPGRCAKLSIDGIKFGVVGEIHPDVCDNYDIGKKVYVLDLEIAVLIQSANLVKTYKELPKYPALTRDIALIVQDDILIGQIEEIIKEFGGDILSGVKLFDVYKGEQIKQDYKSVAWSLMFRSAERTLTDEEVNKKMEKIIRMLEEKIGAKLRDS